MADPVYYYRVRCTDNTPHYEYIWTSSAPTVCPSDGSPIDTSITTIVRSVSSTIIFSTAFRKNNGVNYIDTANSSQSVASNILYPGTNVAEATTMHMIVSTNSGTNASIFILRNEEMTATYGTANPTVTTKPIVYSMTGIGAPPNDELPTGASVIVLTYANGGSGRIRAHSLSLF